MSMRRARRVLLSAVVLLAVSPDVRAATDRFRGEVRVDLVTVEAVVVDPEGRPVPGLGRQEFVLREDGVEQTVTHFEEVADLLALNPGGPPRPVVRRLLVFLDWMHTAVPLRASATAAVADALAPRLDGSMTVRVVSFDGELRVHGPESGDAAEVRATLLSAAASATHLPAAASPTLIAHLETLAERVGWLEDALEGAMRTVAGEDGRKIALIVTPGVELGWWSEDGRQATCERLSCIVDNARWRASLLGAFRYGVLGRTAHTASELGFTLHVLDPSGAHVDPDTTLQAHLGRLGELRSAAEITGGTMTPVPDAARAVETLDSRTRSFYALAYQPEEAGRGGTHEISLAVRGRPELEVVHRSRYIDRPFDERRAAALRSELLLGQTEHDLGARVDFGRARTRRTFYGGATTLATVPVTVRVPLSALTLVREEGKATGAFLVSAVALELWRQRSLVANQRVAVEIPAAELEQALRDGFWIYDLELQVEASSRELRVGVADAASGRSTVAALTPVVRQEEGDHGRAGRARRQP